VLPESEDGVLGSSSAADERELEERGGVKLGSSTQDMVPLRRDVPVGCTEPNVDVEGLTVRYDEEKIVDLDLKIVLCFHFEIQIFLEHLDETKGVSSASASITRPPDRS
jgi:hypothetical protein